MNSKNSLLTGIVVFLLTIVSCNEQETTIVINNNSDLSRVDEPVVIDRENLGVDFDNASPAFPLLINDDGDTIPSQVDDMDLDGTWDELFFLVSVDAFTKLNLKIVPVETLPEFETRTNIRFARKLSGENLAEVDTATRLHSTETKFSARAFQMEGPAWENDVIGFRNYYDARNGMDIFGKITSEMVLDEVGLGENYHEMQSWGMDILKVGNALGAGSIALVKDDSLYRVGPGSVGKYKLVTEGPLRSVFQLIFNNWSPVGDDTIGIVHEIAIQGGANGYKSTLSLTRETDSPETIAAGIVNMQSDAAIITDHNEQFKSLSTFDRQSFFDEYLGMAILASKNNILGFNEAPEEGEGITQSYYASFKVSPGNPVTYYFLAGWEKTNPDFADKDYFIQTIQDKADGLMFPVEVEIK